MLSNKPHSVYIAIIGIGLLFLISCITGCSASKTGTNSISEVTLLGYVVDYKDLDLGNNRPDTTLANSNYTLFWSSSSSSGGSKPFDNGIIVLSLPLDSAYYTLRYRTPKGIWIGPDTLLITAPGKRKGKLYLEEGSLGHIIRWPESDAPVDTSDAGI